MRALLLRIPFLCLLLLTVALIDPGDLHAGCSPYIGRATINEIDVHNQSGNSGPYFVEVKSLDSRILSTSPPLWQNWTLDICSQAGANNGSPCRNNIPIIGGVLQDSWLVIDQNIIQWNYLDLNADKGNKTDHGMEIILRDENDDVVDYLTVDGYSVVGSSGCSYSYDTDYVGGNNFNIQRVPDGIGDWDTTGSGNSGEETENETNDPVPADSPDLTVADTTAAAGNNMLFTLRLSAASDEAIQVVYSTQNGTAVAGTDYAALSGTITIPAGATSVQISVATFAAGTPGSYFFLKLNSIATDNAVIINNLARGTILPSPLAEYQFEGCNWTTGAIVVDELNNYPGTVVQGAHTAPGSDYGGGLCNVANLQNEGTDYNRHISLVGNPIPLSGDWTLMMWINFPPVFTNHYRSGDYRYSVIAGGDHDLCWVRQHRTTGAREWGASSNPSLHRAAFPSSLTGWQHLAFVGNGSRTDLYVNGVYYNSVGYKQTGNYTRIGTTADPVSNSSRQNLDTQLDELKFYTGALPADDIYSIYDIENQGLRWDGSAVICQPCGGGIDHVRIEHTGEGLTCQRSDVTLRACSDAACSTEATEPVTVTLTPATANPPSWIGGDTRTFTGSLVVPLRQTISGTVSLGLTNFAPAPANGFKCFDSGVEGDCDIDFYEAGFIFDVPDLTSCQTSPNVSIQAVRADSTTTACIADAGFASVNKTVNFWSSYTNPNSGTESLRLSGTNIGSSSASSTGIALNFDATATANFTVNYPDAGQMQLDARYDGIGAEESGLVMLGNDSFIARPVGLCVYSDDANSDCATGNASCSEFRHVDQSFNLKVKAVCWEAAGDTDFCSGNSTTPNYQQNGIPITQSLVAPTTAGSSAGTISVNAIDMIAADNGEHIINNQTVSEVGVFTFTATPPNYFGQVIPSATSVNVGRFTPDHFVTTVAADGTLDNSCTGFTYIGQPFGYDPLDRPIMTITATDSMGDTTVNYRDDFVKLTTPVTQINMPAVAADASNLGADLATLLALTWSPAASNLLANDDGTLTFTLGADQFVYSRDANSLVAPFTSDIRLSVASVIDSDGVAATGMPEVFAPAGIELRYGQLVIQNVYGPETLPLPLLLSTQFYNGTSFVTNPLDNCTPYDSANLGLSNYQGNLSGGDTTPSGNGSLLSGVGTGIILSAPGATNDGSVDLTLDLSSATGLNLEWLRPGGVDPIAKATFGIYKGNERLIYMRESVQ